MSQAIPPPHLVPPTVTPEALYPHLSVPNTNPGVHPVGRRRYREVLRIGQEMLGEVVFCKVK